MHVSFINADTIEATASDAHSAPYYHEKHRRATPGAMFAQHCIKKRCSG